MSIYGWFGLSQNLSTFHPLHKDLANFLPQSRKPVFWRQKSKARFHWWSVRLPVRVKRPTRGSGLTHYCWLSVLRCTLCEWLLYGCLHKARSLLCEDWSANCVWNTHSSKTGPGSVRIGRGFRQGCSLSRIVFNLFNEYLTKEAIEEFWDFKIRQLIE